MSKKKWRTRTKGTPSQIGTHFPITERGSKIDLPTGLKKVNSRDIERVSYQEDIERLANDLDHAVQVDDLERIIQLYLELEALEKQIELIDSPQGVRREKLRRALNQMKSDASDYSDRITEEAEEKLNEGMELEEG